MFVRCKLNVERPSTKLLVVAAVASIALRVANLFLERNIYNGLIDNVMLMWIYHVN